MTIARPPREPYLGLLAGQARLMWEWRSSRLSFVRRFVLSYLVSCLALAVTAWLLPGLTVDGPPALLLGALLLAVLNDASRLAALWLLVLPPIIVSQLVRFAVEIVLIILVGRVVPGIHVTGLESAVWGAVVISLAIALFADALGVSDDHSYYGSLVRQLVARNRRRPSIDPPGLLVVQVDGLSRPVLEERMRAGTAPALHRLVRSGEATLGRWIVMLPSVTPASQAGILHGTNDDIPGFRWYEKPTRRLLVANRPADAAEIVRRISDGHGLLAPDGASVGNLVTGDAARSYLTMATIRSDTNATEAGLRRHGLVVNSVDYGRLVVLMIGEVLRALYQAERRRSTGDEPRLAGALRSAGERAVTNVALRILSTTLVIEELYAGAPIVYVDFTGFDATAHHSGPERRESSDALEAIDRSIDTLIRAARHTTRPYHLVVLSDHGQTLGATFRQRHGISLGDRIAELMGPSASWLGAGDAAEYGGSSRRMLTELGRGPGLAALIGRTLPSGGRRHRDSDDRGHGAPAVLEHDPAAEAGPDLVVCASGNLGLVSFTVSDERLTLEAIEARYPGLVAGLRAQPGIGAILVRSERDGALVLGPAGTARLDGGPAEGIDPLPSLGPGAAECLRRLDGFGNVADLVVVGAFDERTGEVVGFEELIGSHGGLGGPQTEPFILYPSAWRLEHDPPVGAPGVHHELRRWLDALQGPGTPTADRADRPSSAARRS